MPERGKIKVEQLQGYPNDPTKYPSGQVDADGNNIWSTPAGTGTSPQDYPNIPGEFLDSYDSSTGLFTSGVPSGGGGSGSDIFGNTFTAPPSSGWTWDNQGSSTFDNAYGYLYASFLRLGAVQLRMLYRTAPSPPYTVSALIAADISGAGLTGSTSDSTQVGLGFRDGSGKIIRYNFGYDAGFALITQKWTSSTSGPSTYKSVTANVVIPINCRALWMRIEDDNTNLKFYWSVDGNHWILFDSRSRTDHFASGPTQYGLVSYCNGDQVECACVSLLEA